MIYGIFLRRRQDTAFELKKTITRDGFMRLFAENKDSDEIVELSLDPNVDFVKGFLIAQLCLLLPKVIV